MIHFFSPMRKKPRGNQGKPILQAVHKRLTCGSGVVQILYMEIKIFGSSNIYYNKTKKTLHAEG